MPIYRVQGPDGKIHRFEGPAGASPADVEAFAAQQFKPVPVAPPPDPSEGGGTLQFGPLDTGIPTSQGVDRLLSGMGAGMSHMARGVGQLVGLSDQAAVDEAKRLEAPLQETGAGKTGDILGRVATVLPTALIPGANTMLGASLIGGGTGALTTEGGAGDRAVGGGIGAVAGPLGILAGRGLVAVGQGAKAALIDPFTREGQERIAARTLQQFAGGPQQAQAAAAQLAQRPATLPGVQPTAGELTDNAGLAQLERTLRQNPELAQAFTERLQANRGALVGAVEGIAGTDPQMAAAIAARDAAANPLYAASRASNILPDAQFAQLAQRPAMQQAMDRAVALMGESGQQQSPGAFLHTVKTALDDMLQTGPQRGVGAAEGRAVAQTRAEFIRWLETQSPEYGAARQAYAQGSQPINQMEIGQALRDRLVPALADYGAPRTNAATFATALRDGDQLAARATGMPNATLENTLSQDQQNVLQQVAQQLGRRARADELGRIPGSPTAQNLVSQNLLRQILGPLGLPESMAENTLAQSILRPAQFVGRLGEQRVINRLADASLNPDDAAALLMRARPQQQAVTNALAQILRLSAMPTASGASN